MCCCANDRFLWRQVTQTERHENSRLARAHEAAKAIMPLTLSGICNWVSEMALELTRAKAEITKEKTRAFSGEYNPPDTPNEHIRQIQAIIRTTDNRSVNGPLAEIIRELQTLWSRALVLNDAQEMYARTDISSDLDGHIVQSAQIYALTESLFDYARIKLLGGRISLGGTETISF